MSLHLLIKCEFFVLALHHLFNIFKVFDSPDVGFIKGLLTNPKRFLPREDVKFFVDVESAAASVQSLLVDFGAKKNLANFSMAQEITKASTKQQQPQITAAIKWQQLYHKHQKIRMTVGQQLAVGLVLSLDR